uniref:Uncharacterized protein n=1 Tax=Cucumis melo TaxID=3656 RepID=A0A9I9EKT9_CUCME
MTHTISSIIPNNEHCTHLHYHQAQSSTYIQLPGSRARGETSSPAASRFDTREAIAMELFPPNWLTALPNTLIPFHQTRRVYCISTLDFFDKQ